METPILTISARILFPLLMIFAAFMLFTGHDAPGGGFAGGLVLTTGLALYLFGNPNTGRRELRNLVPLRFIAAGLWVMLASGVIPLLAGEPFLTPHHLPWRLPMVGHLHLGTPLLFDIGVALVSTGSVSAFIFTLEGQTPWRS